jgi:hypothetical protein
MALRLSGSGLEMVVTSLLFFLTLWTASLARPVGGSVIWEAW